MDDYEKMLNSDRINSQLKNEIKQLNKRQNKLINRISNILRNVRSNNFHEPHKLNIALDNLDSYFEQLRRTNSAQNDILLGLLKRCYKIEEQMQNVARESAHDDKGEMDADSEEFGGNYKYYNKAFPKLNNFRLKRRK